ncbi:MULTISPECIES: PEP-CTERM sorting domain-containing protein [unclassified Lentimonas]|uniref:PEP-CTERM sorting domain-containing protein n=1 Tax=unclassified Lentimonas TaxID=2630993 RepID=UPI0013206D46|nr:MULTISPECIES: PEP-CTERM sorting domain-containing protein [unclassified Lentimonas]CAA6693097.1 Unannotated [Lentimonas sp. CC19]CAA6695661.1 Unannotated [Lentimonas sp. CC10]CAA7071519.1 Unannotated [Lentimonas sp. CC11]
MDTLHKFLATAAMLSITASASAAELLVGWDGGQGFNAPPPSFQNSDLVEATIGAKNVSSFNWSSAASNDGTYGSIGTPAAPNNSLSWQVKDGNSQTFTITNISGADLPLGSIHFDYGWVFQEMTIKLYYDSGDLDAKKNTFLSSVTTSTDYGSGNNDWEDADIPIGTVLTDTILANNESATFRFDFIAAGTAAAGIDNVGITVDIPEPASVCLVTGLVMMGAIARRRKHR